MGAGSVLPLTGLKLPYELHINCATAGFHLFASSQQTVSQGFPPLLKPTYSYSHMKVNLGEHSTICVTQ